jgi:hypothetical protein
MYICTLSDMLVTKNSRKMALDEATLIIVLRDEFVRAERILSASHDEDTIANLQIRLECLYGYLIHIHDNDLASNVVRVEVLEMLRQLLKCVQDISELLHSQLQFTSHLSSLITTGRKGRTRYDLPSDQLVYFVEHGFTCSKISDMLGISQRSIRRRMTEYGISIRQMYSNIGELELRELITEAHEPFPNAGYRFIRGWLMQKGFRVQEQRVRRLMSEVDRVGVNNRLF